MQGVVPQSTGQLLLAHNMLKTTPNMQNHTRDITFPAPYHVRIGQLSLPVMLSFRVHEMEGICCSNFMFKVRYAQALPGFASTPMTAHLLSLCRPCDGAPVSRPLAGLSEDGPISAFGRRHLRHLTCINRALGWLLLVTTQTRAMRLTC